MNLILQTLSWLGPAALAFLFVFVLKEVLKILLAPTVQKWTERGKELTFGLHLTVTTAQRKRRIAKLERDIKRLRELCESPIHAAGYIGAITHGTLAFLTCVLLSFVFQGPGVSHDSIAKLESAAGFVPGLLSLAQVIMRTIFELSLLGVAFFILLVQQPRMDVFFALSRPQAKLIEWQAEIDDLRRKIGSDPLSSNGTESPRPDASESGAVPEEID